jgi:hypothetical protein
LQEWIFPLIITQRLRVRWRSSPDSRTRSMTVDFDQSEIALLWLSSQSGVLLSTTLSVNGFAVRAQ